MTVTTVIQTQPTTEQLTQTTAAVPSSATEESVENGNIMTDDGMNWSPLMPVD